MKHNWQMKQSSNAEIIIYRYKYICVISFFLWRRTIFQPWIRHNADDREFTIVSFCFVLLALSERMQLCTNNSPTEIIVTLLTKIISLETTVGPIQSWL